ncbi:uncharacterized protein QC763_212900 [Podospora pseudopauciseta]|uniref:ubiquitinyl hydrolase 1 n=1 Tax=Podospora pseudopauciseta TaxID=2093780 RepID=A0ABR0HRR6_9PEZI|nr:hypothetical protein QC763_212900 [Podospora pseudopauciseta]
MMNNRAHLPAGQQMQGGADMGGGPPPPRRGNRHQYGPAHGYQYQQHQHHVNPSMYGHGAQYMNPYPPNQPYYMPYQQYHTGAMPQPYLPPQYNHAPYTRSPPAVQQYVPLHQPYGRPAQHSPIVSSPYQPPPPAMPPVVAPLTPSTTHSFAVPPLTTIAPSTIPPFREFIPASHQPLHNHEVQPPIQPLHVHEAQPPIQPEFQPFVPQQQQQPFPQEYNQEAYLASEAKSPAEVQPEQQEAAIEAEAPVETQVEVAVETPAAFVMERPFNMATTPAISEVHPITSPSEKILSKLPWFSNPEAGFPARAPKSRRRRPVSSTPNLILEKPAEAQQPEQPEQTESKEEPVVNAETTVKAEVTEAATARSETPSTHEQQVEDTPPTTPSSAQTTQTSIAVAVSPSTTVKPATRSAIPALPTVPAVPVLPVIPRIAPKELQAVEKTAVQQTSVAPTKDEKSTEAGEGARQVNGMGEKSETESAPAQAAPAPTPAPAKPKAWAALFAKPSAAPSAVASTAAAPRVHTNGNAADVSTAASGAIGSFPSSKANSLAEALQAYRPTGIDKLPFIEPRGLVNTGNMCYMNSVLQVLIFCIPFYDFLDQVSKKATHSFKSETPLIDALIMFMREFKIIDSATSTGLLQRRLKPEELEQYGESFTPEFVYEAIRKLPRFASMRRGHQQDAQEFLGFLLEGLHDECAQVMRTAPVSAVSTAPNSTPSSPTTSKPNGSLEGADDWLEVGPRQRAAVTRSSGHSLASPINKIFGGKLRSELRVPGNKTSVTLEPYEPLQLDIGAPEIRNIIDALKGLTRPETLHGDFNSPHGKNVKATKQIFIESVPPVLILHLKRFQFDAEGQGGTVKIWKKIGYPLEFEFPQEVLSRSQRNSTVHEGVPRYKLTAVVYHHGKNASGGHYTVDVRRQDGREWIRIDDTVIRRVRSEDVAEGGAEEDQAKSGSGNQKDSTGSNRFGAMNDEDTGDDDGWKQAAGGKKWSSVVNTPATNGQKLPPKQHKDSIKDNKVAYLLFYQRV